MTKRFGFTLAEVLITLGIIGVVAAMTMPTLINQTNGAQYKAAYKKALSAISQGVTLNVALDDKSFADDSAENILPTRMNVVKNTTAYGYSSAPTNLPSGTNKYLYFNDSSMFGFTSGKTACAEGTEICAGFIDVNGDKGPNKVVRCDTDANTKTDAIDSTSKKITQDATACTVTSPTDIYPVYYYDQTIVPSTNAGRTVLYGK